MLDQKEIDEQRLIEESDDFLTRYLLMYKESKENEVNCEDLYLDYVKIAKRRLLLNVHYEVFKLMISEQFNQKPIEKGIYDFFNIVLDPELQVIHDWDKFSNK